MRFPFLCFTSLIFVLTACYKGQSVDLIVHNAKIHTMDENGKVWEAMAIRDGKIVEVGAERQILNKYSAEEELDAQGKEIYPGLIDAHTHMVGLAERKLNCDLTNSKSFAEVLVRMEKFASKTGKHFLVGKGWDQSLWGSDSLPTNQKLNELFPKQPVALFRIDGHAVLVNDVLLKQLKIDENTQIPNGLVEVKAGKCTGLLLERAMELVLDAIPAPKKSEMKEAMLQVQNELLQYGITGIHEAGITRQQVTLFQELTQSGQLKLAVYAMLLPSKENREFAQKEGIYQKKNLTIRSFKVIGDGALGSRGACLRHPYSDFPGHHGVLTTSFEDMKQIADLCSDLGYQMNTHAIGDSTNGLILQLIQRQNEIQKDHRWRIEHAQVLSPKDLELLPLCGAFPSVQPTHAVSDQRWAESRLGKDRMKGAYAYQSILNQTGIFAFGTDFPVEDLNPFLTIHAAVNRQDRNHFPSGGFYPQEAVSLMNTLKAMTIWAAMAGFQEDRLGSLGKGKDATFVVLNSPLSEKGNLVSNYAYMTWINGKKVYSFE